MIAIITMPGDIHADAVAWTLRQLDQRCMRWIPYDLASAPVKATISIAPQPDLYLSGPDGNFTNEGIRSIWLRRFTLPRIPESLHPADKQAAERETDGFLHGIPFIFGKDKFWANPPAQQRAAALKIPQLIAAHKCGLTVPKTLLTNDINELKAFLSATQGQVIYKPFYPAVWRGSESQHVAQTVLLDTHQLDDPESLRLCPGIFQAFIPKAYELRVTIFGRTCIAAKIYDQDKIDWRRTYKMQLESYQLPPEIETKLFAFMDELGLSMGAIDIIVTPEGEYVFLEINEQGQFLWVEQRNPDISLLEPFAHFLMSADPKFLWKKDRKQQISFSGYLASEAYSQFRSNLSEVDKVIKNPFLVME